MNRLKNKVVVVFGGARGIGAATARECVAEGAQVYSCDIREIDDPELSAQCSHSIVDATNEHQVAAFVASVVAETGRVDVLFSNVGIHLGKPLADATVEDFNSVFSLNVRSTFLAVREVLPHMIRGGGGSIVINSSNGGLMGRPADPVYNASKHALVGLAKSIAVAHAHQGIRANTVNPGGIMTDMLLGTVENADQVASDDLQRRFSASTPAARVGQPWEVAKAVVFLASDESRFVNGIALAVDGAKAAGAMPANRYALDFELGIDRDARYPAN
ncbi:SDR family NAD(P)-dependent oxidoreductase [Streptacidiphilus rugosus]|uniref:SDR family NAD(P)-dependent oxidoreductase n=1 Tax=Streptacidiphilus rugosus TaxID=405783 RepID=UPI00055AFB9B|nr:SDR family oxidoreductase [Streptacidiphilus rugosus]